MNIAQFVCLSPVPLEYMLFLSADSLVIQNHLSRKTSQTDFAKLTSELWIVYPFAGQKGNQNAFTSVSAKFIWNAQVCPLKLVFLEIPKSLLNGFNCTPLSSPLTQLQTFTNTNAVFDIRHERNCPFGLSDATVTLPTTHALPLCCFYKVQTQNAFTQKSIVFWPSIALALPCLISKVL